MSFFSFLYYGISLGFFLLSDEFLVKDSYGSGMYVFLNELENSLILKEINYIKNEIFLS